MSKMLIKTLLVIWRDKITKSYFHIGTLSYDGSKYSFEYTHHSKAQRKVYDAMDHGYRLHPTFVDLEKKYEAVELFPAFDRRIPSDNRTDYLEILEGLKLPLDADRMDILQKTRGIISSDPYFFEEPLVLYENHQLTTNFYINGMRYLKLPDNWNVLVNQGDQLLTVQEKDNVKDHNAIKIKTVQGLCLGYVPGVYAQAITTLIERGIEVKLTVEEKRATYAPQWWIRVSLEALIDLDKNNEFDVSQLQDIMFYAS